LFELHICKYLRMFRMITVEDIPINGKFVFNNRYILKKVCTWNGKWLCSDKKGQHLLISDKAKVREVF